MKQILPSLLTVLIFSGGLLAQTPQTKAKANAGRQPENGSESRSNETDEHGHHRFYKDTLLAKAGIFYDSLSLKGYRVLTTAQLQGNANYLAKFSANQTLVNSLVQENGGKLSVSGAVYIRDSANINGLLTVGALTSLGNGLNVNGATNFNGITNLNNAVFIKGPVTTNALTSLGAGLNVKGAANFSDSVNISGATSLNGSVIAKGPVTANALTSLGAGLNVKGTTNLSDSVNVNGPININTLMSLGSGLNVKGPLTSNALTSLTAGLNVKGTTNFSDSVNVNGPININAAISLGSGLNVNGPVVLKNGLTLPALPAGEPTDSLLTIGADGTVKRKNASLLFNLHPSFSNLSLSGPLTGTTAQFNNGLSLGSTNSAVYQWQVAGGNSYLALSTAANANAFTLQPNGNIGIGTAAPGNYQLAVEGAVGARKLKITQASTWADYVFEPFYQLQPLSQVEAFIKEHKHLPEVPSAKEVAKNGIDMGETTALLLKKIEELTLYMIELKAENQQQQKEIDRLKRRYK